MYKVYIVYSVYTYMEVRVPTVHPTYNMLYKLQLYLRISRSKSIIPPFKHRSYHTIFMIKIEK
jgi:hypothetical protein